MHRLRVLQIYISSLLHLALLYLMLMFTMYRYHEEEAMLS